MSALLKMFQLRGNTSSLAYPSECDLKNTQRSGFTLIEILIILVIFATTLSFAFLAFGDFGKARQAKITAEHLQNLIEYFREQAVIGSSSYTIKINSNGYQVFQANTSQKKASDVPTQLSSGTFPSNIVVTPHLVIEIQSSGNITPFKLIFGSTAKPKLLALIGRLNGTLKIEPL